MQGLTSQEVRTRIEKGLVNKNDQPITRTYKQIFLSNLLTFFNFLNIALFVMVLMVGSYKNSLFLGVIVCNTAIGIIQEIRAKKTIDKLAIVTQSQTIVIRDNQKWNIATDKLVLDDLIIVKAGDQIPADSQILSGTIEVNESLLTGESDNLVKTKGDELYSGSFCTAGEAQCRVIHVGSDNYASKITSEAKEFKRHHSELRGSLNAILKVISIVIVPMGALLFYRQYIVAGESFKNSVVSTVAAVLGMIPEGLVLLTSIALTLGAMTLARKKTLVQELYCIETLARVDILCLDKTGTITEGTMKVEDVVPYPAGNDDPPLSEMAGTDLNAGAGPESDEGTSGEDSPEVGAMPESGETSENGNIPKVIILPDTRAAAESVSAPAQAPANVPALPQLPIRPVLPPEEIVEESTDKDFFKKPGPFAGKSLLTVEEIERIMGNLMAATKDQNATAEAIRKRFPARNDMQAAYVIPFSSDRKYSGASFEGKGTYLIGAAQFLFPDGRETLKMRCANYAKEGLRVLVLSHSPVVAADNEVPDGLVPEALIVITDVIREEAPATLRYFREQGVSLKIISGDDPVTVAAIAKRAGLPDADQFIDASLIRTGEEMQKAVRTYSVFGRVTPQQKKEMVLALKGDGHTVAMTGDGVNDVLALKEADCSIAMAAGSDAAKNIANVVLLDSNFASMPHIVNQGRRVINNIRTAASMFLIKTMFSAMLALITIFASEMYPFEPIQMSLISACAVGIPTFLLAQENNFNRIDNTFLRHVFLNAFPSALTITGCVTIIMIVSRNAYHSAHMLGTACFLVTGWNYMAALKMVYAPLSRYRKIVIYSMQLIFFTAAVVAQKLLGLTGLEFGMIILVFVLMTFSPLLTEEVTNYVRKLYFRSIDGKDTWIHRLYRRVSK